MSSLAPMIYFIPSCPSPGLIRWQTSRVTAAVWHGAGAGCGRGVELGSRRAAGVHGPGDSRGHVADLFVLSVLSLPHVYQYEKQKYVLSADTD